MAQSLVLAFASLLAFVAAAPAGTSPAADETLDVVTLASVTYTMPILAPAGTVQILSTATTQTDLSTDIPAILRRTATSVSDTTMPMITLATTTYEMPNIVPAGTVDLATDSTATTAVVQSELPVILREKRMVISSSAAPEITPVVAFAFPDLVPAGTVQLGTDSTATTAVVQTDLPVIM